MTCRAEVLKEWSGWVLSYENPAVHLEVRVDSERSVEGQRVHVSMDALDWNGFLDRRRAADIE